MQIEGETRLADRILQRAAGKLEDGKRKLTEERDQQLAEIENKFGGKTDPPSIVRKGEESDNAHRRFAVGLQRLNESNLNALEIELMDFRARLKRIQDIMSQKGPSKGAPPDTTGTSEYKAAVAVWKQKADA